MTSKVGRVIMTPKTLVNCPLLALPTRFSFSVASSLFLRPSNSFYTMFSSQNSNNTPGLRTYSRAVAQVELLKRGKNDKIDTL